LKPRTRRAWENRCTLAVGTFTRRPPRRFLLREFPAYRVARYLRLFCRVFTFAQRAFCAMLSFLRVAADIVCLGFVLLVAWPFAALFAQRAFCARLIFFLAAALRVHFFTHGPSGRSAVRGSGIGVAECQGGCARRGAGRADTLTGVKRCNRLWLLKNSALGPILCCLGECYWILSLLFLGSESRWYCRWA
jgi:hypothetical protein